MAVPQTSVLASRAVALVAAAAILATGAVFAQETGAAIAPKPEPASAAPLADAPPIVAAPAPLVVGQQPNTLPANTEILLRMNEDLTSKKAEVGQQFYMSVSQDVIHGGMIVIPRGTRGIGEVTWRTGRGGFGKSGKMEVEIKYLEMNGRRIPVLGKFRQEGEGNTVATIGAVVLVGVLGGFVTGKSAVIPRGRELPVHTVDPLPYVATAPALPTASIVPAQN